MPGITAFAQEVADEELRLSDLPAHYVPIVQIETRDENIAMLAEGLGAFRWNHSNGTWFMQNIVQYEDRAFFVTYDIPYEIIQTNIATTFEWWDEDFAPAPAGRAALPGLPGHMNNTGRPDLTVDPDAVFNPEGVTHNTRFGFPTRTGYRTLTEFYAELNFLAEAFPDTAILHVLGTSHLGKPIVALEISSDPGVDDGRPNHVHTGGTHAREWSASEYAMNLAWYLLTQYDECERITNILDTTRIWILPVVNPDGVHWDQRNNPGTWRKNRRDNSDYANFTGAANQTGVDLNRNFPYDFVLGTFNIQSEDFRGPAPGSEPEIQALMRLYLENQIMTDISGHTFGHFNIFQDGDHINNEHIWTLATELFQRSTMAEQASGAANANGQSIGWMFGTANTMSILTEYGHHGFVRPYMGEPHLSRFGAIAPFDDYHGRPRRVPLAYRHTNIPGNSGAPTTDIVAPMAFLDHVTYGVANNPLTFQAHIPQAAGMQATVANVNSLGEAGGLMGRILVTIQGADATVNRDVVLAAQRHGALAVIFVGGNAAGGGWQSTDFYVPGANVGTTGGQPANFNIAPVGTSAEANAITIPVATSYRMAARQLHEWVRGGGENMLTLTSTPADDPANAHLYPVIPFSQLCFWYQYVPTFLHVIEAAERFTPIIHGEILCENGELLEGASLELYIDNPNRIRQGTAFNAAGQSTAFTFMPEDTFVQTRRSRLDSEDGTFRWSVTPSVQRDFVNAGYTITAMPPAYSGLYAAVETGIHIEEYKERVELDFVLERAISVDYDTFVLVGDDVTLYVSTANPDYTLADLIVSVNGEVLTDAHITDLGNGTFRITFSQAEFGEDYDLIIAVDDENVIMASYRVAVDEKWIAPTGISFTLPATIRRNQSATPVLTVLPESALQEARWTSSNPALASVNAETGVVTARAASGIVIITATTPCGNFRHSVTVRLSA